MKTINLLGDLWTLRSSLEYFSAATTRAEITTLSRSILPQSASQRDLRHSGHVVTSRRICSSARIDRGHLHARISSCTCAHAQDQSKFGCPCFSQCLISFSSIHSLPRCLSLGAAAAASCHCCSACWCPAKIALKVTAAAFSLPWIPRYSNYLPYPLAVPTKQHCTFWPSSLPTLLSNTHFCLHIPPRYM